MKLFGFLSSTPEQHAPSELAEVTLVASSEELREIAGFLLNAAQTMEQLGKNFDHMHLSDTLRQFENSPTLVVAVGEFAQDG
ncbi:Imm32 family immunity protein [Rhodanobacter sp. Col0626]|uniref:Imm32 family immunity protein n=1 Tax=Rhodanobacter sp. Col0626 TaxID=3415679 RepID=UPI003CF0DFB2